MTLSISMARWFRRLWSFGGPAYSYELGWFTFFYVCGALVVFQTVELVTAGRGLWSAYLMLAYLLAFLVPFLAVIWRRCRTKGASGLVGLIPFAILAVGIVISLIEARLVALDIPGIFGGMIAYGGFLLFGIPILLWLLMPAPTGDDGNAPNPHEVPK